LSLCIATLRRLGGHGVVCLGRVQRSVSRSTFRLAGRGSRRGPEEVLYALDDVLDGVGRLGLGLAGVGGRSVEHRADGVLHLLDDVGPRGGGLGLGGGVRGVRVDEVLHVLDELLDEIGGGGGRCWGGGGSRLVLGDLGVFNGGGWRSGGRSGAVQHVAEWRAGDEVVHRLDDLLEQVGAGGGAARLLAHLVAAQGLVGLRLDLLHRHEILRDRDGLQRSDRLLDGLDWRLLLLDDLRYLRNDDGGLDGGCCFLLDDGHHLFGVLLLLLVLGHDDGGGLVDGFDWGGLAQRLNRGDYLLLDGLLNCHRVYGDDGDGFLDGSDGRKITQRLDRSDYLLLHDGGLLFGDNRDLDRFRLDNGRNGTQGLDGGDGSDDGGGFLSNNGLLLSDDGGNNLRDLNGQHGLELRDGFLRLLRFLHGFDDDGHGLGYLHHRLDGLERLYRCDDGVLGGGNLSFGGDHGGGLFGLLQDHFRHGLDGGHDGFGDGFLGLGGHHGLLGLDHHRRGTAQRLHGLDDGLLHRFGGFHNGDDDGLGNLRDGLNAAQRLNGGHLLLRGGNNGGWGLLLLSGDNGGHRLLGRDRYGHLQLGGCGLLRLLLLQHGLLDRLHHLGHGQRLVGYRLGLHEHGHRFRRFDHLGRLALALHGRHQLLLDCHHRAVGLDRDLDRHRDLRHRGYLNRTLLTAGARQRSTQCAPEGTRQHGTDEQQLPHRLIGRRSATDKKKTTNEHGRKPGGGQNTLHT
uniref:Uncharacterized protein n=1 Tax=Anopheles atroparvus TaxID=41427 RepID=A0AAG5DDV7_ANOAO